MTKAKITWVKSSIGSKRTHRAVLKSLGLHRLNQTVEKELTAPVKGMVDKVAYLLKVEVVD
jgi:large subunit ribosomal protein L30